MQQVSSESPASPQEVSGRTRMYPRNIHVYLPPMVPNLPIPVRASCRCGTIYPTGSLFRRQFRGRGSSHVRVFVCPCARVSAYEDETGDLRTYWICKGKKEKKKKKERLGYYKHIVLPSILRTIIREAEIYTM